MTKNQLWALLALVLGASGGAALKSAFDGTTASQVDPTFQLQRVALFEVACPEGTEAPCYGLEVCGSLFTSPEAEAPVAQGCWSEAAPPDDAGVQDRLLSKGRAMLRRARADDAGALGSAHVPSRVAVFQCEACDGGYGIEAQDDLGGGSAPLDELPPAARKLARDFWPRRAAKDAGATP